MYKWIHSSSNPHYSRVNLYTHMPHFLYPFIRAQTLKMFPFLAYYESCCSEHAVNLFGILISSPLDLHPEVKLLDRRIVAV